MLQHVSLIFDPGTPEERVVDLSLDMFFVPPAILPCCPPTLWDFEDDPP